MSVLKSGRPTLSRREKAIASVQEEQEEFMRMNVNIPKTFHKKIKRFALEKDTTITEVVIKAVEEYMSK